MLRHQHSHDRLLRFAFAYDRDGETEGEETETVTFTLPEDLTSVSDEDLATLREEARENFDALYQSEDDLDTDDVQAMQSLADAITAIRGEEETREETRRENREAAEALAEQVHGEPEGEGETEDEPVAEGESTETAEETSGEEVSEEDEEAVVNEAETATRQGAETRETVAASSRGTGPLSVTMRGIRRRQSSQPPIDSAVERSLRLVAAADLPGYGNGQEIGLEEAADAVLRRTSGISERAYRTAFRTGKRLRQTYSIATLDKNIPDELTASSEEDAERVMGLATDEARLEGGSLVAAGGWCSPSETLYDLLEEESADGLFSLPEIGVARGGIRFTKGPDFSAIFDHSGYFAFTEDEAEAGAYSGEVDGGGDPVAGEKPCYRIECPEWEEHRLNVAGVCLTAGLLQQRTYPEMLARVIRGTMIAHQHKMAQRRIQAIQAGSDAVTMPAGQIGAIAPLLTSIELQTEHYRYVHRLARATTLEAVFPFWVRGLVRSDLSRRLGVELFSVSNQQIQGWFAERGINPQFVYNYQDITGASGDFTAWPAEVKFLLYPAGTWVGGSLDVISLDTMYDSALLKQNDFTALFTEEGWMVAKRGRDSREVTVPVSASGATHGGVEIAHDGTAGGGA